MPGYNKNDPVERKEKWQNESHERQPKGKFATNYQVLAFEKKLMSLLDFSRKKEKDVLKVLLNMGFYKNFHTVIKEKI